MIDHLGPEERVRPTDRQHLRAFRLCMHAQKCTVSVLQSAMHTSLTVVGKTYVTRFTRGKI